MVVGSVSRVLDTEKLEQRELFPISRSGSQRCPGRNVSYLQKIAINRRVIVK